MTSVPTEQPIPLHRGVSSIKPVDPGPECAREADSLDRLAADHELIQRLMWAQYEGAEWRKFREALAQYGVAVLHKWILSGRIFKECALKGFGIVRRRRRNDADEALGMAGETVARAMVFFRKHVLVRGLWDPTRGASIRTYFVGACILNFPNVYELVQGGEHLESLMLRGETSRLLESTEEPRALAVVEWRNEAARALEELDEETRRMVLRRAEGYTDSEIGELLKITPKAVETRFYRLHRRTR